MSPRSRCFALLILGAISLAPPTASADSAPRRSLTDDWPSGGVALFSTNGVYYSPRAISDDAGGAIAIFFMDVLRAQRVDSKGNLLWGPDGIALGVPPIYLPFALSPDGAGGAYVAWSESGGLFAQHLNAFGAPQWTGRGLHLGGGGNPTIVADGSGGALVAYGRGGAGGPGIYAQRVSSAGDIMWAEDGVPVITGGESFSEPEIVADATGAYVVVSHSDYFNGPKHVHVGRVDASGVALWTRDIGSQYSPTPAAVSDDASGVIVAWWGLDAWYGQRLDLAGTKLWMDPGVTLFPWGSNSGYEAALVRDGVGGAVLMIPEGIAMRVSANGSPLWSPPSGVQVFGTAHHIGMGAVFGPALMQPDETGGYVAFVKDAYADSLFGQRLSSTGERLWSNDGMGLASGPYGAIASVGDGGAIYFFRGQSPVVPFAGRIFPVPGADVPPITSSTSFLAAPAPNPARDRASVDYYLSEPREVSIEVFGVDGRRVKTLVHGVYSAGSHHAEWNLRNSQDQPVRPGVYLLRFTSARTTMFRKLVVRG